MMVNAYSFVLLLWIVLADSLKYRFPTYYMEKTCDQTISGHESARVEISTGLLYQRNMNCRVTLTVPDGVDMFLYFKRFSLEKPFKGVCVDYLDMYKGPPSAPVRVYKDKLCGEKLPWTMNIEASTLTLHFVSDRSADDMGFELLYAASRTCLGDTNSTSLQCGDGDICLDKSLICDRVQQCPDGRDERNCTIPAPQPDESIPIIAGSTVGGTAVSALLVYLCYLLYQYVQERRILRRCEQVKLEDTYPITKLYRNSTFFGGSNGREQQRSRNALGRSSDYLGRTSAASMGRTNSAGLGGREKIGKDGIFVDERRSQPDGQMKSLKEKDELIEDQEK
ncbi:uncharacterized protein LOC135495891 [Lineus longissimus]|uniref:uncharacterized protein LOC135495891 n=1 Tax=Lineus longissimus TaxID=88925 RepID=UPI002B4E71AA